jgi:hypothetical protein
MQARNLKIEGNAPGLITTTRYRASLQGMT